MSIAQHDKIDILFRDDNGHVVLVIADHLDWDEFDEGDQTLPADIPTRDAAVASVARRYFDVMLSYTQLRYIMAWGLVDKYSWLQGRWQRADGLEKRPNFYDDAYQPNTLRAALADALRAAPMRSWLS